MQISEIEIYGFGKWHDQIIPMNQELQVFFGKNEAGKSTIYQFIKGVLFGFATGRKKYDQYIPKQGSQYGGKLTIIGNNQLKYYVERVKGKGGGTLTITDDTGQEYPSSTLNELMGSMDVNLFQEIFQFDQNALNDILKLNRQDFNNNLLSLGAVGSDKWLKLAKDFEDAGNNIYKPKGHNPALNKALTELEKQQLKVTKAKSIWPEYQAAGDQLTNINAQLASSTAELALSQQKVVNLENLKSKWENFSILKNVNQQLKKTTEPISNETNQAYQLLLSKGNGLKAELAQLQTRKVEAESKIAMDSKLAYYLENKQDIEKLANEQSQIQQQIQLRDSLQQQINNLTDEKQQLRTDLPALEQQVEPLSTSEIEQVKKTLQDQTQLIEQRQTNQSQIATIESQRTQLSITLNQHPVEPQSTAINRNIILMGVIGLIILIVGLFLPGFSKLVSLIGLVIVGISAHQFLDAKHQAASLSTTQSEMAVINQQMTTLNEQLSEYQEKADTINNKLKVLNIKLNEIQQDNNYGTFADKDWYYHQNDIRRFAQITADSNQMNQQLMTIDEALKIFWHRFEQLQTWVKRIPGDESGTLINFSAYLKDMQEAQLQLATATENLKETEQRFKTLEHDLQIQQTEMTTFLRNSNVETQKDFEEAFTASVNYQTLKQQQQFLTKSLDHELASLENYDTQQVLIEELDTQLTQRNMLSKVVNNLKDQSQSIQLIQRKMVADGELHELQQEVVTKEAQITNLTKDWLSDMLANEWIQTSLSLASGDRLPKLIKTARQYFAILTENHYDDIKLLDDGIIVTDNQHQNYEIGELSKGTAEQLYISLRFAFAVEVGDAIHSPILIDDGFVNFDWDRRRQMFKLLAGISNSIQIIYFTADEKAVNLFEEANVTKL